MNRYIFLSMILFSCGYLHSRPSTRRRYAKAKATPTELTDKDIDMLTAIGRAEEILGRIKEKEKKIIVFRAIHAGREPVLLEIKLPYILSRLEEELIRGKNKYAAHDLKKYFTELNYGGLEKALKDLAQAPRKKLPKGVISKSFNSNIGPYVADLRADTKRIIAHLDLRDLKTRKSMPGKLHRNKARDYGLNLRDTDPWKIPKKNEPKPREPKLKGGVNLGALKSTAKNINIYLDSLLGK